MLNGTILWATVLAIGVWLLASGISGTLGIAASGAGAAASVGAAASQIQQSGASLPSASLPDVNPQALQQYAADAARAGLFFLLGSLLGLVATLIGSVLGARTPRLPARPSPRPPARPIGLG